MKITFIGLSAIALGVQAVMAANQCNCDASDTTCLSKCGKYRAKTVEPKCLDVECKFGMFS